jgi:hypothetical protein
MSAEQATGDSGARMQWSHYFLNVVQHYQVTIEGWPDNMPFANLGQVLSARSDLEKLYSRWESKETKWKVLTDDEFQELHQKHLEQLASSENIDHPRRTRSDKERNTKHLQQPQTHIATRSTKALRQLRTVMKSTSTETKNRTN